MLKDKTYVLELWPGIHVVNCVDKEENLRARRIMAQPDQIQNLTQELATKGEIPDISEIGRIAKKHKVRVMNILINNNSYQ